MQAPTRHTLLLSFRGNRDAYAIIRSRENFSLTECGHGRSFRTLTAQTIERTAFHSRQTEVSKLKWQQNGGCKGTQLRITDYTSTHICIMRAYFITHLWDHKEVGLGHCDVNNFPLIHCCQLPLPRGGGWIPALWISLPYESLRPYEKTWACRWHMLELKTVQ
jgi:hypothetical protein